MKDSPDRLVEQMGDDGLVARAIGAADRGAQKYKEELRALAAATGSPALLQFAELAVREAPLEKFAAAFRPIVERLRQSQPEPMAPAIHFEIGTGSVTRDGVDVRLSQGTLAFFTLLAVSGGPLDHQVLLERLWPALDHDAATNVLKMCVYRTRLQLGSSDAVVTRSAGYTLGTSVATDYERVLELGSSTRAQPVSDALRDELEEIFSRLVRGERCAWAPWEWFLPTARRLNDACRAIGQRLITDALERGERTQALQFARQLSAFDPRDASARLLIARTYRAIGDAAATARNVRRYPKDRARRLC